MHTEAASSSSDITSESSSDDEEYLQQVPMDKMRIVKSYRRVKTQLRSLKRKKKLLLIQEKVVKEEKSLFKNLLFRSIETSNKCISSKHTTHTEQVGTSEYKYDETDLLIQIQRQDQLNKALSLENTLHSMKTEIIPEESIKCANFGDTGNQAQDVPNNKGVVQPAMNVVQTEKTNNNKLISSKHTTCTEQVGTSEYKYNKTDLLIQIQREEQLNKALSLENTLHSMKSEIIPEESIKCANFGDTGNQAQDVPTNKGVVQPAINVATEKNIIPNANLNTQLNKSADQPDKTNLQIDQNTDQGDMENLQESKGKQGKIKRKYISKQSHGKVIYKMIDLENGYYIKISKPLKIRCIYFLACKKLLQAMKPIINEFADFISPQLFMHVIRKVIEKEITGLLVGKEKIKSKDILEMFREKYPEAKDGYYVISNLVAIWRGDYNDPPDPNDPFNKLIAERDPQKLVSFEDISNSKGVWEIIKILPEETPKTNEKTKKQQVDTSVSSKTDLDDSFCESATESKDKHETDSSLLIIDDGENMQRNKEEITVLNKIEQENETTNIPHIKKTVKRSNEANSENEDPYLDNVIKRLCTEKVEIPSKQEIHAQATHEAIEKGVKPAMETIETRFIPMSRKNFLMSCSK